MLKFIEDNWFTGRIGDKSFDADANSISSMLDFTSRPNVKPVILNPTTGAVVSH